MNVTNLLSNIQLTHSLPFEPSFYLRATDRLSVFLKKKSRFPFYRYIERSANFLPSLRVNYCFRLHLPTYRLNSQIGSFRRSILTLVANVLSV